MFKPLTAKLAIAVAVFGLTATHAPLFAGQNGANHGAHDHGPPIGSAAAAELPIFDAHIHYKEPAWAPFPT